MGMFDSFTGNSDGYTGAQRSGLRRSEEIKRKRKEDERTFELKKMQEQQKFQAAEASKARGAVQMSEMQKQLHASTEAGKGRMAAAGAGQADIRGAMDIQKERGFQTLELQQMKGEQSATDLSMKMRRELSVAEAGGSGSGADVKPFTSIGGSEGFYNVKTGKTMYPEQPQAKVPTAGETARAGLANQNKTLTQFMSMSRPEQSAYITEAKKRDPSALAALKREYGLLQNPQPETDNTYRNY